MIIPKQKTMKRLNTLKIIIPITMIILIIPKIPILTREKPLIIRILFDMNFVRTMLFSPFSGRPSLSLSLYAQLAAVDCDTFLVAPFPEFNDAEDAAGSASVLRNVLFCQRVTDTVIDMLHATCCLYKWLIHFSSGGGTGTEAKALNRPWPTGCSSSARGSVERGPGEREIRKDYLPMQPDITRNTLALPQQMDG